jgi:hypothetical protein
MMQGGCYQRRLKGGQSHGSRVGRRKHVVWHRGKLHFCEFCNKIRARLKDELDARSTIQMATRRKSETMQMWRQGCRHELRATFEALFDTKNTRFPGQPGK